MQWVKKVHNKSSEHVIYEKATILCLVTICRNMILISKITSCKRWVYIKTEVKCDSYINRQIREPYCRQINLLHCPNVQILALFGGRLYLFQPYTDSVYTSAMRISRDGVNKVCSGNLTTPTGHTRGKDVSQRMMRLLLAYYSYCRVKRGLSGLLIDRQV